MADLERILYFIEELFGTSSHPDYPNALNGLQVDGPREVQVLGAAVDASEATIREAVTVGVDFLLVHHGLFWDGFGPITGPRFRKVGAPETKVQLDVLVALRQQFDRVSSERLVSGSGLENIYWALGEIHGDELENLSAKEIFVKARDNSDTHAAEAVGLFFEVLGQFAGDLALALGAYDGVYVAGGIVKRYPNMFANSRFRSGFEQKGRHRTIAERIPTQLILHEQPGLLGASYCALQLLKKR